MLGSGRHRGGGRVLRHGGPYHGEAGRRQRPARCPERPAAATAQEEARGPQGSRARDATSASNARNRASSSGIGVGGSRARKAGGAFTGGPSKPRVKGVDARAQHGRSSAGGSRGGRGGCSSAAVVEAPLLPAEAAAAAAPAADPAANPAVAAVVARYEKAVVVAAEGPPRRGQHRRLEDKGRRESVERLRPCEQQRRRRQQGRGCMDRVRQWPCEAQGQGGGRGCQGP
jgi:hypothetical protein